ncbi:MAG: ferrous iron transporter B [Planctomycetota bacterium]
MSPAPQAGTGRPPRIAVLGNPNTGKTTLFNRLCGARARTANFPGSTVEGRIGTHRSPDGRAELELVDLPGTYSLALDTPESQVCRECLAGEFGGIAPDAMLVVVDSTNLRRNLGFAAQVLLHRLPAVVALNMWDVARTRPGCVDPAELSRRLGCPVVPVSGRSGDGVAALDVALDTVTGLPFGSDALVARLQKLPPAGAAPSLLAEWADAVVRSSTPGGVRTDEPADRLLDRVDIALTHPFLGIVAFAASMAALFAAIFLVAQVPMDLIDLVFGTAAEAVHAALPQGILGDLLADGVVAGIGGVLVFLPQICLLFFLLTLLEDCGYLARAALAVDRVMRRFGLSGLSFIPLLSSHACALPGIMSTRLIRDERDRLATILVAPFMSCSARMPVYVLLIGILSVGRPAWFAGVAFAGCYALGAAAGLASAFIARRTLLRGPVRPMVMELPPYRWPSLRTAALVTWDRASVFVRNAGTMILAISVVMWWLSAFPRTDGDARAQQASSFAGQLGDLVQPAFAPLGFDSQLTVGVMTSFLAREVFVSTMAVLAGSGAGADSGDATVLEQVGSMARADGAPVFDVPTTAAALVFFVLAMQCLPTLAVTRRESGGWKWPAIQFGWMTLVAYVAALAAHVLATAWTGGSS